MERETPVTPVRVELLCPTHAIPMKVVKTYLEHWVYRCPNSECHFSRRISYRDNQYPYIKYVAK